MMCSWQNFLVKTIKDFKNKGHNFNHKAEMNNITIANKLDMSDDFLIRHNLHAVDWKLIALINKNERLIKKLNRTWWHHLIGKFEHVPVSGEQKIFIQVYQIKIYVVI